MRPQPALNLRNPDEASDFYGKFFNTRPHKIRKGDATRHRHAAPAACAVRESAAAARLNHLGVEVFEQAGVERVQQRFSESDILDSVAAETLCCHAAQNKIRALEPRGLRWE